MGHGCLRFTLDSIANFPLFGINIFILGQRKYLSLLSDGGQKRGIAQWVGFVLATYLVADLAPTEVNVSCLMKFVPRTWEKERLR